VAARRYRRLDTADWSLVPHLLDAAEDLLPPVPDVSGRARVDLLDVDQMTPLVNGVLAGDVAGRAGLVVTDAELVSSTKGRRQVVRYVARRPGSAPVSLIGKWYSDARRARLLYDHLQELSQGPFQQGRFRVPAPVAYLPSHGLVLYRPAEGRVLAELDLVEAGRGVRDAADWLVALHSSNVVLPRAFDIDKEAASTAEWARTVGGYDHRSADRACELAARWAQRARTAQVSTTVPIHKDFHAGHVLVSEQTYAIDLDEARYGDPAFDLAHFCVYLTWQQQPQWGQHVEALRQEFLQRYAAATGWVDSGSFGTYSAYTWLKIAKQIALRSGPARAMAADRDDALSEALARGLACLDQ
jgi:aminoglycoside phosphotransferase (APT) family kinase protein